MKKAVFYLTLLVFLLAACGSAGPATDPATAEPLVTAPPTPAPTASPTTPPPSAPDYPVEGFGPGGFPEGINPLTGLPVADPALLDRRPLIIKVENLPRNHRPQYGLSFADLVYEYYTEEGTTRFAAVFYGQDAETVGPIRSARFFDAYLIRAYKGVFAFGSADVRVRDRLYTAEFASQLVLEGPNTPLRRIDPNGYNLLVVDTAALSEHADRIGLTNDRQDLDGMFFQAHPPEGGQPATQAFVRYSSAIYNRWDYDPVTGRYLRFSDVQNDYSNGLSEVYEPLGDRATGQQLAFDNIVVLCVTHEAYSHTPEMWDILLLGSGRAYIFRDGQMFEVSWQRNAPEAVLSLSYTDGTPFPFRPGTTWFEVIGMTSSLEQTGTAWRFTHQMP
ncbi:MAG: DUF3048 domain-containing protein [Anaerolineales bacterium]|nr:DUF3048 domain-containing protein [Anaerolineales bacterium]